MLGSRLPIHRAGPGVIDFNPVHELVVFIGKITAVVSHELGNHRVRGPGSDDAAKTGGSNKG